MTVKMMRGAPITCGLAGVLAGVVLAPGVSAQAAHPVSWAIADRASCVGLTLGYAVPIAELQRIVGARLRPARGPSPDTGLYLLFVARCPGSTIGGRATGPFVTAHALVPIEPPPAAEYAGAPAIGGWITAPSTIGAAGAPVRRLFAGVGFPTVTGSSSLDVERRADTIRVRLVLTTARGRVTASATFADSAVALARTTGIVTPGDHASGLVVGPEHSRRRSGVPGSVRVDGSVLPDGVHASSAPSAALDTRFAWRFDVVPVPAHGRRGATSSTVSPGTRRMPR